MAALEALGGETWFRLGDGDLATHVERTRRLRAGESLSQITDDFRRRFGIAARILPMSDDPVRTRLKTADGWLDFQDYFVRQRCEPAVSAIEFAGAADARPQPRFLAALADPASARRRDLPVEPVHQHRADPRRCPACARRCATAPRRSSPSRRSSAAARSRARPRR